MADIADEERHLAEANRHIAEAEERVGRQEQLVSRLAAAGHDTAEAEGLLKLLHQGLDLVRAHRQMILRALRGGGE